MKYTRPFKQFWISSDDKQKNNGQCTLETGWRTQDNDIIQFGVRTVELIRSPGPVS